MRRSEKNPTTVFNNLIKYVVVGIISVYQLTLSPILTIAFGAKCRYEVSCSRYTQQKIMSEGVIKGSVLGVKRLLSCQPFARIQQ